MAKLESDYKGVMVKAINDFGGYATRLEDQYRVGLLDLIFCTPETGVVLAEAKRFTGNFFEPSLRQWVEMKAIEKGGGVPLLIGVKNELHYLAKPNLTSISFTGRVSTDNPDCVVQEEGEAFPELFIRWFKEKIRNDE